jgi:hypothetical protein
MSTLNQPDAIDLIDRLENENRKLRALNAELLEALKDAANYMAKTGCLYRAQDYLKLVAKAEGKCAN